METSRVFRFAFTKPNKFVHGYALKAMYRNRSHINRNKSQKLTNGENIKDLREQDNLKKKLKIWRKVLKPHKAEESLKGNQLVSSRMSNLFFYYYFS